MPRVSQERLDARRRQIVNAAARCFARNGFQATSMQDVLKEADLSAGAVYRYFTGKEELISAIVAEVIDEIRDAFQQAAAQRPLPSPEILIGRVIRLVLGKEPTLGVSDGSLYPRLMVQVWAETLRNPELRDVLHDGFAQVRRPWIEIVEAYQDAGMMRADVPALSVARTLIALAQGFVVQYALFGDVPVQVVELGLKALMSMEDPASRT
ncbi:MULTISPECIES: TetR/AcrR family transcriptional regulator [Streptomyces]|uniref:TetR/AcrR family transcriptional regulator n=1 Tax=Streptomyces heilongjiangensis TaxID=945052 RepID=A0ABW1B4U3_9ACTN|nr:MULTISPECIES: TetR/AcrR family transcriptional regulator [Streptomyces]MDC2950777.1 TetR/AcrR family transcriptional regulator [Streptomyces heilongjiangensis]